MADLTQTAANVAAGANAVIEKRFKFGATVAQGKPVYLSAANKWLLADNNVSAVEAGQYGVGIALNAGSDGQEAAVQTEGEINLGATLAVGTTYGVSATAGMICPDADIASTNFVTILGVAKTAAILRLKPIVSGIARA